MKKGFQFMICFLSLLGLAVLILDGKTALFGAREGVALCLNTLVPTLLPFFFLSNLLCSGLIGRKIPILRPIGRLCRIPAGAEYILLSGFLGGYPLGAQIISQECNSGRLSRDDGRRMLAFSNNCGPAFIFGISGALFRDPKVPWLLFFIHVISALIVGFIIPGEPGEYKIIAGGKTSSIQALWQTLRAIAGVCGWVILFRVLLSVLNRWVFWYLSIESSVILSGILELANGCIGLNKIANSSMQMILCSGFFAFGGLCVTMQTYAVAQNVDKRFYFPGKVLQSTISIFLSCMLWATKLAIYPGLVALCIVFFLRKREIRCRNPKKLVV